MGLPRWFSGKVSTCQAGNVGSIPGLGRPPGERNSKPHQYSYLGNPTDIGAWRAPEKVDDSDIESRNETHSAGEDCLGVSGLSNVIIHKMSLK